jgi:PEP-CTERM motif
MRAISSSGIGFPFSNLTSAAVAATSARTRMRTAGAVVTLFMAITANAQNIILNGDFESNAASATVVNMNNSQFNTTVANATAFGTAGEIDLITGNPYGLPPQNGNWKLAIARQTTGLYDAFSFNLSSSIVAGQVYSLDFYAQTVTDFQPGGGAVLVGVSGSATSFGTQIFSGVAGTSAWTHFTQTFMAPVNGLYLTIESDPNGVPTWTHIDNFSLTPVPEPGTLTLGALALAGAVRRSWGRRRN